MGCLIHRLMRWLLDSACVVILRSMGWLVDAFVLMAQDWWVDRAVDDTGLVGLSFCHLMRR